MNEKKQESKKLNYTISIWTLDVDDNHHENTDGHHRHGKKIFKRSLDDEFMVITFRFR